MSVASAACAVAVPCALPPSLADGLASSSASRVSDGLQGLVRLVAAAPLEQGYASRLVSLQELAMLGVLPRALLQEAGVSVARMGAAV